MGYARTVIRQGEGRRRTLSVEAVSPRKVKAQTVARIPVRNHFQHVRLHSQLVRACHAQLIYQIDARRELAATGMGRMQSASAPSGTPPKRRRAYEQVLLRLWLQPV